MFCCRTWPATCWLHWFACRSGAKVESESVPFIRWLARVWSEEVEMEALKQVSRHKTVKSNWRGLKKIWWAPMGLHTFLSEDSFYRKMLIPTFSASFNKSLYASRVWIHFSVKIWTWSVSECWDQVFPTAKKKNSSLVRFGFVEGRCSNGWQDWVFVKV